MGASADGRIDRHESLPPGSRVRQLCWSTVLTEFRLKEATLYLLYRAKYLPFKARKFIDLVLESGAGSGEQPHTSATANVLQYPQRKVAEEVLQERDEPALPSVDPYRTQRGELGVVRPAVGGAH